MELREEERKMLMRSGAMASKLLVESGKLVRKLQQKYEKMLTLD